MVALFGLCAAVCAIAVVVSLFWLPFWAAILIGLGLGMLIYGVSRVY